MKTKNIFLLVLVMIFLSCKTKHSLSADDYIVIYDNFDSCEKYSIDDISRLSTVYGFPTMLVLRRDPENPVYNSYESYFMGGWSFVGKWELEEDTLSLSPLYEFFCDSIHHVIRIDVDSVGYPMQGMLNHKWVIKGDRIFEKADYSEGNEYDENGNVIGKKVLYGSNPQNSLRLRSKARLK